VTDKFYLCLIEIINFIEAQVLMFLVNFRIFCTRIFIRCWQAMADYNKL
jgi:hypothetical protein